MPNIRIIYDNAADRANLSASSTAGSLAVSNLQNSIKGKVHRSVGLSVSYTLSWTTGETIGGVCLPATNLTGDATIRVRLYSDTAAAIQIADSGVQYACPGNTLDAWNWAEPLNSNATAYGQGNNANVFAYGDLSKVAVWFTEQYEVKACIIDIIDYAGNASGYIDCSRLVVGRYWEPIRNVQNGSLQFEQVDLSEHMRTDAGDLLSSRSILHDRLRCDLAYLEERDRAQFMLIAKHRGTSGHVLVSVFPDGNNILSQDYTIYGKFTNYSTAQQLYGFYSIPLEIEGW